MSAIGTSVRCSFQGTSASMIERVVVATVDQLCADADVDIALLDALEYPVSEGLAALGPCGINRIDVAVARRTLRLEIHVDRAVDDLLGRLGDATEIVESFFELHCAADDRTVELIGSLG